MRAGGAVAAVLEVFEAAAGGAVEGRRWGLWSLVVDWGEAGQRWLGGILTVQGINSGWFEWCD
jgi:hypothetical protein